MLPASDSISQPLIHHLLMISKKYLSIFAGFTSDIPLERYHYALIYIYQNNETLTQKDLADYFQVDKSFMVNIIDYLSKTGFVVRETSLKDRRKHFIKLTEKAHQYIPNIKSAIDKTNQLALNNITNEDKLLFTKIIKQVEMNLNIENNNTITIDYTKSKT